MTISEPKIDTKNYCISAYDMLFFGTGRPFTMEDESWTVGMFPPYPSTLYGYLRSVFFENNMGQLKYANKTNDPTGQFKINSFCLSLIENGIEVTQLYPMPFCHVLNTDINTIERLKLVPKDFMSNNLMTHVLRTESDGKKETLDNSYYISEEQMERFLNGEPIEGFYRISKFLTAEERIGISKNLQTGKTKEGNLYRIQFHHLKTNDYTSKTGQEIQFKLNVDACLPSKHIRSLGGEGKKGILKTCDIRQVTQPQSIQNDAVLYFNTPVILSNLNDITAYCNIQTIANDTLLSVGGWDIKTGIPKPMKLAYPAGTVFYISFKNDTNKATFITRYHKHKIGEQTEQGFGAFFLGNQIN